jgi:hypothetical protein
MLTFSGGYADDEQTLIESVKKYLYKLNPTMQELIRDIKTVGNMRDICATIANGLIAFGERTLDVTVLKITNYIVEYVKSNADQSQADMIQATSAYIGIDSNSFTLVRLRYKFVFLLLGFVYHYDKCQVEEKANNISLLKSMMESLEAAHAETNTKLIILDPKSITSSDKTLWGMMTMITEISSTPEYQRCVIMPTIWMTFPENIDLNEEVNKKILYSILARYILRRSLIICDAINSLNTRDTLHAEPLSINKSVSMIRDLTKSIPETSLYDHYNSFGELKKAVYEINAVIKSSNNIIPNESGEFESHFNSRQNIHTMLESEVHHYTSKSNARFAVDMTVGKIHDLIAFPILLYYRGMDGSETVTLLGRTYADATTLFGEYDGNWHFFKGHSGQTWREWFR